MNEYMHTAKDCPSCKAGQLVETLDGYLECNQCDYVTDQPVETE